MDNYNQFTHFNQTMHAENHHASNNSTFSVQNDIEIIKFTCFNKDQL